MQSAPQTNQRQELRPEEAEVLRVLNQARDSAELRAVIQYARMKQAAALHQWQRASGMEELVKYQQQYTAWEGIVKSIMNPNPVITKTQQGDRT